MTGNVTPAKRQPWLKWYPADWRSDPRLRMCSLAARGLWADLIAYMHEGQPYGHLTVDGIAPDLAGVSGLVGRPVPEVRKALAELESRNVFSRTTTGVIYSRRMVRDKAKADRDRANGKGGGNPNLREPDNGGVNPQDKAQIPEARSKTESISSDASHPDITEPPFLPSASPEDLLPLPPVGADRAAQTRAIKADFDEWYRAFPRHEAPKKAEAAYAKARAGGASKDQLLDGARRYAEQRRGEDPKFTKMPATWLHGGCWLDDAPPAGRPNGAAKHDDPFI